jgi:hypothetical protein
MTLVEAFSPKPELQIQQSGEAALSDTSLAAAASECTGVVFA